MHMYFYVVQLIFEKVPVAHSRIPKLGHCRVVGNCLAEKIVGTIIAPRRTADQLYYKRKLINR